MCKYTVNNLITVINSEIFVEIGIDEARKRNKKEISPYWRRSFKSFLSYLCFLFSVNEK